MSVIPVTFQQGKCDTCGGLYEDPDNGSAFEDRVYALEVAADSGWLRDGDQLTCPGCLRCARCAVSPAWVGGEQLESHGQILCEACDPGSAAVPSPSCCCVILDDNTCCQSCADGLHTGCVGPLA